jgi:hypothetical protein
VIFSDAPHITWKLSQNGLATQENRKHQGLASSDICIICGNEVETGHHAVIGCTKATALWHEMRNTWRLPEGKLLQCTGPDWLPLLLGRLSREEKARVLLITWRAWHMHNDMIFGSG